MLHCALLLECQCLGNVTNIPTVLQPSSACQWFRLLTLCCEANTYFIGSGCAGSLSFLFSGCRSRFLRLALAASPLDDPSHVWLTEEKRETARSLCWSWRLKQIIDLQDTGNHSIIFAITEFNICLFFRYNYHSFTKFVFIITLWQLREAFSQQSIVPIIHEQNIICSKTHLDGPMLKQTIVCR